MSRCGIKPTKLSDLAKTVVSKYQCKICFTSFRKPSATELQSHINIHWRVRPDVRAPIVSMCEQEFLSLQAYEKHVCDIVHFCPKCERYFRRHHDFRYHKTKSAICQKGKVSTVRVPMTPDLRLYFESEELKKLRTLNGLSRPSLQDQPDVKDMPNP